MANNIIAYIGYDSFDIILYLSRILHKLGRKVLVVDYSESEALKTSIPQIPDIDTNSDIMTYRRVDFTAKIIDKQLIDQYDDVLIDCGYKEPKLNLSFITRVVYVTNMFSFNVVRLKNVTYYDDLQISKALLIREALETKLSTDNMKGLLNKNISDDNISILYLDDKDYENSVVCQYNQTFRLIKITSMLKTYLLNEVKILCEQATEKEIKKAFANARKGE